MENPWTICYLETDINEDILMDLENYEDYLKQID